MELRNQCVLVTGGAGFIGSHLTELLVTQTSRVRVLVHYNSLDRLGWIDHLPPQIKDSIEIFKGDIRDPNGVREAMKGCQTVFHLAALIGIPYSYHSPDTYVDTNVKGTLNVLQAARQLGVERVIHTSTSEVYGTARFVPITEEHPVNPQSPYAATKASADFLALSFHRSFGTPVTIVRPFNTYGPRQSTRAIIPSVITQLSEGDGRITLGSLHPTRDLTYVTDTARGFLLAAGSDAAVGEVVNLGTGHEITIGDLAGMIAGIMGKELRIGNAAERVRPERSEVERLCAGTAKMQRLTGWEPAFSLEKGLEATIGWFDDPLHRSLFRTGTFTL